MLNMTLRFVPNDMYAIVILVMSINPCLDQRTGVFLSCVVESG